MISNAVLNLQLCMMKLTALHHRKRQRKRLQLFLMLKDLRKSTNGRRFPRARLFCVRPGRCTESLNGRLILAMLLSSIFLSAMLTEGAKASFIV